MMPYFVEEAPGHGQVCFLIFDQVSVEALAAWSQLESTFILTRSVLKLFILVQAVVQTLLKINIFCEP